MKDRKLRTTCAICFCEMPKISRHHLYCEKCWPKVYMGRKR